MEDSEYWEDEKIEDNRQTAIAIEKWANMLEHDGPDGHVELIAGETVRVLAVFPDGRQELLEEMQS